MCDAARLYTTTETGELLGISRDSVLRLVHTGELKVVNVASTGSRPRLRIRHPDLVDFLDARTTKQETR